MSNDGRSLPIGRILGNDEVGSSILPRGTSQTPMTAGDPAPTGWNRPEREKRLNAERRENRQTDTSKTRRVSFPRRSPRQPIRIILIFIRLFFDPVFGRMGSNCPKTVKVDAF